LRTMLVRVLFFLLHAVFTKLCISLVADTRLLLRILFQSTALVCLQP
jgi:hypothetical protein